MKSQLFVICLVGVSFSSCTLINTTMNTLECNRQAIDVSTQTINENTRAIEEANSSIENNRRQLIKINETLKKASES